VVFQKINPRSGAFAQMARFFGRDSAIGRWDRHPGYGPNAAGSVG
jgi:hypothetical protein